MNVFHGRIEFHPRQWPAFASELFARLIEMIVVEMQIAEGVDEKHLVTAGAFVEVQFGLFMGPSDSNVTESTSYHKISLNKGIRNKRVEIHRDLGTSEWEQR